MFASVTTMLIDDEVDIVPLLMVTLTTYVPGVAGAVQKTLLPDELERVPPFALQV